MKLKEKMEIHGLQVVSNPFNAKFQIVQFNEEFGMKPVSGYFKKSETNKEVKRIIQNIEEG